MGNLKERRKPRSDLLRAIQNWGARILPQCPWISAHPVSERLSAELLLAEGGSHLTPILLAGDAVCARYLAELN
jgi:hypothetical protein